MEDKNSKKRPRQENHEEDEDVEMVDGEENLYEKEDDSYESVEDNDDEEEEKEEDEKEEKKEKIEEKKEDKDKIKVDLWDEKKNKNLKEGEILDFDNDAYEMLHRSKVEWPCLSLDFLLKENSSLNNIKDFYLPNNKRKLCEDKYPYNAYIISGSQTNEKNGYFYFMKWYNMKKTKYDDDPDKSDDDDDDEEKKNPLMKYEKIKTAGNINRVKSMKNSSICALWLDTPSVDIINCEELFNNIEFQEELKVEEDINEQNKNNKKRKKDIKYNKIFKKNIPQKNEGFALDWNNITPFILSTGGYDKKIYIYKPKDSNISDIILYDNPLIGHNDSVEDIQWSPNEENVLASCSIDKTIRFWDIRQNLIVLSMLQDANTFSSLGDH